ncbi:MAG TPA: sugar phosphate isomerase/epimerase [Chitinophagaceae bacterium]|jgi:sugar phosphate isomerase/epimerase
MDRRNFLFNSASALGLFAAGDLAKLVNNSSARSTQLAKIALQLYTVRDQVSKDARGTLEKIAAMGIDTVETAFWPETISVKQAAALLKNAGLKVCSAHVELPIGNQKDRMLEIADSFQCKRVIWHGWPEDKRYSSLAGTKELVGIYNEANGFAKSHGLQFGLHNHWWEYRNKVDGRFVYEILHEMVDPDIFFEIDTYWVKVAGQNPAGIVAKFGARAPLLHIKDGPAKWSDELPKDNPDPMVPVGQGVQDFPAIVKAANGNTQVMVVEMDKTAMDVFSAIRESVEYLVSNHLAAK